MVFSVGCQCLLDPSTTAARRRDNRRQQDEFVWCGSDAIESRWPQRIGRADASRRRHPPSHPCPVVSGGSGPSVHPRWEAGRSGCLPLGTPNCRYSHRARAPQSVTETRTCCGGGGTKMRRGPLSIQGHICVVEVFGRHRPAVLNGTRALTAAPAPDQIGQMLTARRTRLSTATEY